MLDLAKARSAEAVANLVDISGVRQAYRKGDNADLLVLDDVSLTVHEGEIVGLLGRSGSGKSTLLRIIAGLMPATAGDVRWCGRPITGPCEGLSMVFQNFALFPWLTVLENVEIGLEAIGVPEPERRRRALEAIDLIGLDGFESAYPKELSGGMRQRVGFARALVVHPRLMLMDEPFSALDEQNRTILQQELLRIWEVDKKTVVFITHSVDEAVTLADKIMVMTASPGRAKTIMDVTLERPRNVLELRNDPRYGRIVYGIWGHLKDEVERARL
jgi:NitT/TauT family transport system ATP-binding protein